MEYGKFNIYDGNDNLVKQYIGGSQVAPWKYYWDFRQNITPSSNVLYDSKNNLAASLLNGITLSTENGAYFSGGIDGSAPYIDLTDFPIASPCTFEVYYKYTSNSSHGRIIDFGNGPENDNIHIFREQTSNTLKIKLYRDSDQPEIF